MRERGRVASDLPERKDSRSTAVPESISSAERQREREPGRKGGRENARAKGFRAGPGRLVGRNVPGGNEGLVSGTILRDASPLPPPSCEKGHHVCIARLPASRGGRTGRERKFGRADVRANSRGVPAIFPSGGTPRKRNARRASCPVTRDSPPLSLPPSPPQPGRWKSARSL